MSIIIRLEKLPTSAKSADIRRFFGGLRIPNGGVHIVGGERGEAFIAFESDQDACLAMKKDEYKIMGSRIKLYLSSQIEMQEAIQHITNTSNTGFEQQSGSKQRMGGYQRLSRNASPNRYRDERGSWNKVEPYENKYQSRRSYSPKRSPDRRSRSPRHVYLRSRSPADRGTHYSRKSPSPSSRYRSHRSRSRSPRDRYEEKDRHEEIPFTNKYRRFPESPESDLFKNTKESIIKSVDASTGGLLNKKLTPQQQADLEEKISNVLKAGIDRIKQKNIAMQSPTPLAPNLGGMPGSFEHANVSFPNINTNYGIPQQEIINPMFAVGNYPNTHMPPPNFGGHFQPNIVPDFRPNIVPDFQPMNQGFMGGPVNVAPPVQPWMPVPPMEPVQMPPFQPAFNPNRAERQQPKQRANLTQIFPNNNFAPQSGGVGDAQPFVSTSWDDKPYGYFITISGLDTTYEFVDIQKMLEGVYVPRGNIKWELDNDGKKTGTAFIRVPSIEDYEQIISCPTYRFRKKLITVSECPTHVFMKYFFPNGLPNERFDPQKICYYRLRGLSYDIKYFELVNFFNGFQIADLHICERDQRRTGIGFVAFFNAEDGKRALAMNGTMLSNRPIYLQASNKEEMLKMKGNHGSLISQSNTFVPEPNMSTTYSKPNNSMASKSPGMSVPSKRPLCAVLTGLHSFVSIKKIEEFFQSLELTPPDAIHITLTQKRKSNGRAFVEFNNVRDFDAALQCHGKLMMGNIICVKQVLFDEMMAVLSTQRAKHSKDAGGQPSEADLPEKVPYLWQPPDSRQDKLDSSEVRNSGNYHHLSNNFGSSEVKSKSHFGSGTGRPDNSSKPNNFNKSFASSTVPVGPRDKPFSPSVKEKNKEEPPLKFEVKVKQNNFNKKEVPDAFEMNTKVEPKRKLTKLSPVKEQPVPPEKPKDQPSNSSKITPSQNKSKPNISKDFAYSQKKQPAPGHTMHEKKPQFKQRDNNTTRGTFQRNVYKKVNTRGDYHNARGDHHNTRGGKQNARGDHHNTRGGKQNVRGDYHNARGGYHNARGGHHNARGDDYSIREDNYSIREDKYNILEDNYNIREDNYNIREDNYNIHMPMDEDPFDVLPEHEVQTEAIVQLSNVDPDIGGRDIECFLEGFAYDPDKIIRRFTDDGAPTGDVRVSFRSHREATRAIRRLDGQTMCGVPIRMFLV